jgi:hypothetical protein
MSKYYQEVLVGLIFLAAIFHPNLGYPASIALVALLVHSKAPTFAPKASVNDDLATELADLKRQVSALSLQKGLKR